MADGRWAFVGFVALGAITSCAHGIDSALTDTLVGGSGGAGGNSGVGGGPPLGSGATGGLGQGGSETAAGGSLGGGGSLGSGGIGTGGVAGGNGGASGGAGGSAGGGGAGKGGGGSGGAGTGGTGGGGAGMGGAGGRNSGGASGAGGNGGRGGAGGAAPCAGNAVQFDGTSTYATIPRVVQDDFTVEAWIKTSAVSLTGTDFFAGNGLIYADVPFNANDFGTSILNNHFTFGVGNPDTTLQATTDVTAGGQWVHVAATRTRTTGQITVIVNGASEGSLTTANTASLTAPTSIILGANPADGRYYAGLMDEVRIWNVARSRTMVAATMHTRLVGNEAGLVGYWRLDESAGASAIDASPSHNNAVFTGTPVWVPSTAPITTCP